MAASFLIKASFIFFFFIFFFFVFFVGQSLYLFEVLAAGHTPRGGRRWAVLLLLLGVACVVGAGVTLCPPTALSGLRAGSVEDWMPQITKRSRARSMISSPLALNALLRVAVALVRA